MRVGNNELTQVHELRVTHSHKRASQKADHYRFSISWSRVLPDGTVGSRNPEGVAFYTAT